MYYVITVFSCLIIPGTPDLKPQPYPWIWREENWDQMQMADHLVNMTKELINDVVTKLGHADKIREEHSKKVTFELGAIAAGLMDRYQKMLRLYKKYAHLDAYRSGRYTIKEMTYAYGIIRGYYHEIRLEQKLFRDIKKRHESTQPTSRFTLPNRFTVDPLQARGYLRSGQKWKPKNNE